MRNQFERPSFLSKSKVMKSNQQPSTKVSFRSSCHSYCSIFIIYLLNVPVPIPCLPCMCSYIFFPFLLFPVLRKFHGVFLTVNPPFFHLNFCLAHFISIKEKYQKQNYKITIAFIFFRKLRR